MVMVALGRIPVLLLAMVDDSPDNVAFVGASARSSGVGFVHDRVDKDVLWLHVAFDLAIVVLELIQVVHPVDWHGHRISYIETVKSCMGSLLER